MLRKLFADAKAGSGSNELAEETGSGYQDVLEAIRYRPGGNGD